MSWRYIAQDARTLEFVHMDLPVEVTNLSWVLSGAGQLSANCTPDTGLLRDEHGDLLLRPWGTFLYAESDGEIRWGGIVIASDLNDQQGWEIQAASFATYPNGISFAGDQSWVQTDPTVPFKAIWNDIQTQHGGNSDLGVLVIADATSELIGYGGTDEDALRIYHGQISDERWAELKLDGWIETVDGSASWLDAPKRVYRADVGDTAFQALLDDGWKAEERPAGVSDPWLASYADPAPVTVEAAPYTLAGYETPDCGSKLDELSSSTPFDWVERHWWCPTEDLVDAEQIDPDLAEWLISRGWYSDPNDGAELLYRPVGFPVKSIAHVVHVYWPRIGGRRTDLAFVQGDNIINPVSPTVDGDEYANNVVGIGAGQGPLILRTSRGVDDGNLYREAIYTSKSITDPGLLATKVGDELAWRSNAFDITEVTVLNHPNAEIGSWQLGDDVFIRAVVPWFGDVNMWCRVTGWELLTPNTARLQLTRSDAFRYGGK